MAVHCRLLRWANFRSRVVSRSHLSFLLFFRGHSEASCLLLQELTPEELREELRIKAKFETFVGTHWSFNPEGKHLSHVLHPRESWNRFYDEEKLDRGANPWNRPVVAWFDVTEHEKA